jgi:hypothetical protein
MMLRMANVITYTVDALGIKHEIKGMILIRNRNPRGMNVSVVSVVC